MMNRIVVILVKVTVMLVGMLFGVACSQMFSPASPSANLAVAASSSLAGTGTPTNVPAPQGLGSSHVGFGFNGVASGFPTGRVFLTGGGSYDVTANVAHAGGGFSCVEDVLQGPLSTSINPNDPGPCRAGDGTRWDTAALLRSTTFKCTGAATEGLKTAVTTDKTVVLLADFYRAGNGNNESFTAKIIVSEGDIAADFPGANLWVERVGCGSAQAMNFSR